MEAFNYRDGELFAEGVALSALAQRFGTPTYVYSRAHIEAQYRAYADALAGMPHLVCFAVKANSNLGVLNVLARLGAGFDIVSSGELERVLAAGGEPSLSLIHISSSGSMALRRYSSDCRKRCSGVSRLCSSRNGRRRRHRALFSSSRVSSASPLVSCRR